MTNGEKRCPYCGADDVLPFESEEDYKDDYSFFIVFLAAILLIAGYFLFVISTYLYFPIALFILIMVSAIVVKRKEEQQKKTETVEKDYMCVECGNSFKARG